MKAISRYSKVVLLGVLLVGLTAPPALAQKKNPERDVFFGQTHSHTSWSLDAYLIGKQLPPARSPSAEAHAGGREETDGSAAQQ